MYWHVEVQIEHQNREELWFKGLWKWHEWAGLSISETVDLVGFSHTITGFTEHGFLRENALSIPEVRGEWWDYVKLIRVNSNSNNHVTTKEEEHLWTQMGCSSRSPHQVPVLSAKNRKLRPRFEATTFLRNVSSSQYWQGVPNKMSSVSIPYAWINLTP